MKSKTRQRPLQFTALELLNRGLTPIPIDHSTKKPLVSWKEFQTRKPTVSDVNALFGASVRAVAVVAGSASGNLLVFDFDDRTAYRAWTKSLPKTVQETLVVQKTGRGFQVWVRCSDPGRSRVLAKGKDPKTGVQRVLIETRANGGYAICPPSLHPNQSRYTWMQGDYQTIPNLSNDEVGLLLNCAYTLDESAPEAAPDAFSQSAEVSDDLIQRCGKHLRCIGEATSGNRGHDRTFLACCDIFRFGIPPGPVARQLFDEFNAAQCSPPWSAKDRNHKLEDAFAKVQVAGEFGILARRRPSTSWTFKMNAAGFYGLAGEICRVLEPHTESDIVAILVQLLVAFGNVVGRGPYFGVEQTQHFVNLFLVLVGRTGKARKGTSLNHVLRIFCTVAESWAKDRVQNGLSSGEGLIEAVRDDVILAPGTETKAAKTLPGVEDKRLLVVEPEFASVLCMMAREGNNLSPLLRQAWDGSRLQTMTKNSPRQASAAHISMIAHITDDELRRNLNRTEMANGLANRYLWFFTMRSKFLPHGGNLDPNVLLPLVMKLGERIRKSRFIKRMQRSDTANHLWEREYPRLSDGKPGLVGAMVSRGEAQVLRLSCLYALLDGSATIEEPHLQAALAVWEYCERSVHHIFGATVGDPIADAVYARLQQLPKGLTRTELRDGFSRHVDSGELDRALDMLQNQNRIGCRMEQTGGRPAERWVIIGTAKGGS